MFNPIFGRDVLLGNDTVYPLDSPESYQPPAPLDLAAVARSRWTTTPLRRLAEVWALDDVRRALVERRCAAGRPIELLLVSTDGRRAVVADRMQRVYGCDVRAGRRVHFRDMTPLANVRVFGDVDVLFVNTCDGRWQGTTVSVPSGAVIARVSEWGDFDFVARTYFHAAPAASVGEVRELDTNRLRARIPLARGRMVAILVAPSGRRTLRVDAPVCAARRGCDLPTTSAPRPATLEDESGRVLASVNLDPLPGDEYVYEEVRFTEDESRVVRARGSELHVFDAMTGATIFRGRCELEH